MAYTYRSPDRDQQFLLPPSVRDWLPEDHLVWFVLDVVQMMDLSAFHARHPNDGVGRRAYDPEMMLALLIYAYCTGLRSSRRIARGCRTDLAMRAIVCDVLPEHDAIGRFRAEHEQAIADAFVAVLGLCARAGLASLGVVAVDGTKIASDAALDANRSEPAIRTEVERILAEAQSSDEVDAVQPRLSGELPEPLARRDSRLPRLRAALAEIEDERETSRREEKERAARRDEDARAGRRPRGRVPKDPAQALERAQADLLAASARLAAATSVLARLEATEQRRRAERAVAEAEAAAEAAPAPPEAKANVTDPESRIMKTATGWLQGYNAQAAVNERQVVLAALVTNAGNDVGQLRPVIAATERNAAAAGIPAGIGTVLADAGYWSEANATAPGPDRLIATLKDWKQRKAAREMGNTSGPPPEDASPLDQMEHRLRTEEGAAAYAQRSCTVEPVFGQAKENRGFRRFMRRGLSAAQSEWALICATGNICKLFAHAGGRSLAEVIATSH